MPLAPQQFRITKELVRISHPDDKLAAFHHFAKGAKLPQEEWPQEYNRVLAASRIGENLPANRVPIPLTDELCYFLDMPPGTWMPRPDAVEKVRDMMKSRGLVKKQIILNPDNYIRSLLRIGKKEPPMLLFNLEERMDHLFLV